MTTLNLDSFYKELTPEEHEASNRMEYDFDHPSRYLTLYLDAFDFVLAFETIKRMKMGKRVMNIIYGANVILVEGLMTFYSPELREVSFLLAFTYVFVVGNSSEYMDSIIRDIEERKRDLPSVLLQYTKFVKPNFDKYISPLSDLADIMIPWSIYLCIKLIFLGSYNNSAIDTISKLIMKNLKDRRYNPRFYIDMSQHALRCELISNYQQNVDIRDKIHFIEQTTQVRALQTIVSMILRDCKTDRLNFCHHSRRLIKLCLAKALSLLNFPICAVSVLRAGQAFDDSVKDLLQEYSLGKIIVETDEKTNEPQFHYFKLPADINNCHILLFDATITSGASALMAIKTLLVFNSIFEIKDHNVREEDIILITLILTSEGVMADDNSVKLILNEFPKLKIVSSAIDDKINEDYFIIPGFGNFGKRDNCS
ncbi:LOW QUALITY PROTEIN: hypothetical protein MXB_5189 [Myxobolus squamalis]|nr:LOW QUALITY PROTEIN: hypothetical protein MXB_5189 [Myxobolus squamalis]